MSLEATFIPGFDERTKNTNSCLYRAFPETAVVPYDHVDYNDNFPEQGRETVVVHSYGYYAFLMARAGGRLRACKRLLVIDGWFPSKSRMSAELPTGVSCVFFFPTFGDRTDYPLEAVVRQAMVSRADITVVRGVGFSHNLVYGAFGEAGVRELVSGLAQLPTERTSDVDHVMRMSDFLSEPPA